MSCIFLFEHLKLLKSICVRKFIGYNLHIFTKLTRKISHFEKVMNCNLYIFLTEKDTSFNKIATHFLPDF